MATFNITHVVKDPSGSLLANIDVVARLNQSGFRIDDNSQVAKIEKGITDAAGSITLALEAQSNITPANTYWIVEVKLSAAQGGPELYTIRSTANQTLNQSKVSV